MSIITESKYEHIGETRGCQDHDHDLVHELSRRLDGVWRYDQYIANAESHAELQKFWRSVKTQEQANIRQLKQLITEHIRSDCF